MTDDTPHIASMLAGARTFPFWRDSGDAPRPEPEQIGATSADLVIVGGGFTGLWAAIQAKEANPAQDIVLIEARRIASGASGRPGGIISTSIMHGLHNTVRTFPDDVEELERLGRENMDAFTATLTRHGIDADIEWSGELTAAVSARDIPELHAEFELHQRYGHNVTWLDEAGMREQLNSPAFHAGFWSKDRSGTVHPGKLAWGLKAAILKLGVRVHELSPMLRVESQGDVSVVHTPHGQIRTGKVLLATDSWAVSDPIIKRRLTVMQDRMLATAPLTREQMSKIGWPNRQGIYDTGSQLNYFRLTKENRIIFGGHLDYYFNDAVEAEADRRLRTYYPLVRHFLSKFPNLEDVKFTNVWGGPISVSSRFALQFYKSPKENLVWVGGYSGFGVGASRFGARLALAILNREKLPELDLAFVRRSPGYMPPEPLRWIGAKLTTAVLDDVDKKGGWRRAVPAALRLLRFPT
jgi:glycine/D-amino acid oxidase-like deaminating enzyme